jgi:hypothetical protein
MIGGCPVLFRFVRFVFVKNRRVFDVCGRFGASQSVDTRVENGGLESNRGKKVAKGYVGEEKGRKGSSWDVVR